MRRLALSLLAVTLLGLFAPLLLRDRVIYPHDNTIEAGLTEAAPRGPPSNRRLSDASHYYLPALAQQLRGTSAGWIATWDPHVELGKPCVQLYGLGKAFLPTHVLSWLSDDPLRVYTWSAVLAVALACLFAFLLLEALGLHPLACLTGALGIGIGSLAMYALCFTLFLWGVCWTVALFWCATLFLRRPSAWSGLGLAFFTHALLLSGYPQFILWHAYLLGGYVLLGLARHPTGGKAALGIGARLLLCVLAGAASALPVYWDLLEEARRSTRLAFDPDFFAEALPDLGTWAQRGAFVASVLDADAFGSLVDPQFQPQRAEPFLLPLWAALAAAGVALGERRRTWPILLCAGAALALTLWPDAYVAAVRTLGFALSRSVPLRLAHVPLVVLAALAVDRVLRGEVARTRLAAGLVALTALVGAAGFALAGPGIDRSSALFAALVVAGTLAFLRTRGRTWRAALVAGLAVASGLVHGQRLLVSRAREEVCLDSPLVQLVRAETAGGARFAWAGASIGEFLAPNQEALLGLRSIHSYNPLFSTAYQGWAARHRKTQARGTHDRRFLSVIRLEDYLRESAALAGTTVILSVFEQDLPGLRPLGRFGPIRAYRVASAPIHERQVRAGDAQPARLATPDAPLAPTVRTLDLDDHKAFQLTPLAEETLLFVSQQYHPRWIAEAGGQRLETVAVDGIYQGVRVPPGTDAVELVFRTASRWSWIPQVGFSLGFVALLLDRLRRRTRDAGQG